MLGLLGKFGGYVIFGVLVPRDSHPSFIYVFLPGSLDYAGGGTTVHGGFVVQD